MPKSQRYAKDALHGGFGYGLLLSLMDDHPTLFLGGQDLQSAESRERRREEIGSSRAVMAAMA